MHTSMTFIASSQDSNRSPSAINLLSVASVSMMLSGSIRNTPKSRAFYVVCCTSYVISEHRSYGTTSFELQMYAMECCTRFMKASAFDANTSI